MTDFLGLSLSLTGALGTLSLLFALLLALYALACSWRAGARPDARLEESARRALWSVAGLVTLSVGVLEYAILNDDFSVRYVAQHSMTVSPLWVKIVTLWAALEGSILLWAWVLSIYAALVAWVARRDVLRPWVMGVMSLSLLFFIGLNLTVVSPFTPVAQLLSEGKGPNPLLQNHWMMAVHPVLMYFGFVGLSVPFAYGVAALLTGRLGESWLIQTRRWTLVAWGFLTMAIVSGGWWSYEILGWGGYWAWDPVENASFVPWLLATAFLHSVQVQERRRLLKGWNIYLIVFGYAATVLGTFLTRSGVVESVHAFGTGPVGAIFLGFFAVLVLLGVGLVTWRLPRLRETGLGTALSREGGILAGNIIFVVFAVLVVLATLFPIFLEAVRGFRTVVGAPFYNQFAIPLGLFLLLGMGLTPLMPWRGAGGLPRLWELARVAVVAGVVAGVAALGLGVRNPSLIVTVALCAFNVAGLADMTLSTLRTRAKNGKATTLVGLVREFPRRYGAYLAHVGIVVLALGVGFSTTYAAREEVTLNLSQPKTVLGKQVTLLTLANEKFPEKSSKVARVRVGGEELLPRLNNYVNMPQEIAMPAVKTHFIEDTYVTLLSANAAQGWVTIALIKSPLVSWIWWGTVLVMLGTAITFGAPVGQLVHKERKA